MNKLELIFNFTLRAVFWGVVCCGILGAIGALLGRTPILTGVISGAVAGVIAGLLDGLIIGIATAQYFYPLKTRRNYDLKLTLFGSGLTLIILPLIAEVIARLPNSDAPFLWLFSHLLMWIISVPIIGYFVTAWYLKTHAPID
jgi:hypothetical protein